MFDNMKQLMEMQKKMQEMKEELNRTTFEVASADGLVRVTMTGSQEVRDVVISVDTKDTQKTQLEKAIKDAYNRAVKRSHDLAAEKMRQVTGYNLPGIF